MMSEKVDFPVRNVMDIIIKDLQGNYYDINLLYCNCKEVVCRCILEGIGDAENVCQRLNEQQDTISALKDIFKDIITYSEWDSKKPYCSLRIAVDKKHTTK